MPSPDVVRKFCQALEVSPHIQFLMLDLAGKDASAKLDDPQNWREGLKSFIGGKSIIEAALYNARTDKGWTQAQLAERSGVSRNSIEKFESGERIPGDDNIHKLCVALELGQAAEALLLKAAFQARNNKIVPTK